MGAAGHIGRVGGLAVALGIGTAVLTGQGTAAADTGKSSSGTSTSAASGSSVSKDPAARREARTNRTPGSSTSVASASESSDADDRDGGGSAAASAAAQDQEDADDAELDLADDVDDADSEAAGEIEEADTEAADEQDLAEIDAADLEVDDTEVAGADTPEIDTAEIESPGHTEPLDIGMTPVPESVAAEAVTAAPLTPAPTGPVRAAAESLLLAASRRQSWFAPAAQLDYSPVITLEDSVITGTNPAAQTPPVSGQGHPLVFTVVGGPNQGGKVLLDSGTGNFTFLPDLSVVNSEGVEQFSVLVSEITPLVAALSGVPLVGGLVQPIVFGLQQTPIVSDLLSPLIGHGAVSTVDVSVGELAPTGTPVAFTTLLPSFDGTLISVNYFPVAGATPGYTAPTVFNPPGLGQPGNTDPNSVAPLPGIAPLREAGYNVVTWDPRGEFASGGLLQMDNPAFEGQDVRAILDWVATLDSTQLDAPGDPRVGMVGGSYGGAIQLVVAGTDPRVDAIVPMITWNSLNDSFFPDDSFKTSFAGLVLLNLVQTGARVNPQIMAGMLTGIVLNGLGQGQQAVLASSGPDFLLGNITAPTMFVQGTVDVLFPLQQALNNAAGLDPSVPSKMVWFCGGHGPCLDPVNPAQEDLIVSEALNWLARYVKEEDVDTGPAFAWFDQNGDYFTSEVNPLDPTFDGPGFEGAGAGGFLPIVPILGGSGPQGLAQFPVSLGMASRAANGINLTVAAPQQATEDDPVEVVGAPQLSFTYSGIGTADHLYAQVVDDETGRVLGNIVTPVPVTLDGRTHTATIDLADIAYTMGPDDTVTVQLVASATAFESWYGYGFVNVSDMSVVMPTVANAVPGDLTGYGLKAGAPVAGG
ncbi:MAG: CocE/NonD family hydrolase [Actinomycetota bacterium]|nr:CocE/NonD family hydrolase [Actinomycetota bacterium]